MKTRILILFTLCILLTGCKASQQPQETPAATEAAAAEAETTAPETETTASETEGAKIILPLTDTTMEALNDSMVNISFGPGDFRQDEAGNTLLKFQVYSYDKFDMVDIAMLEPGDILLLSGEEVIVTSVECNEHGTVLVNGGLDAGGFDLVTDDTGIYYVQGYSDMKSWYLAGEADYMVADSFVFTDSADLDLGTVTYTAEDFLNDNPALDYGYLPQNTIIRIENGAIVTMDRVYTP